ncbi:4-hydroxy-tetrahydrodipicolinate synthase [Rhizobium sp. P40RR-XXII]|uniref:4-hydroxy-tetrahydrodipicolinate synthase n=1 Tax=unclassified Rhizobium TaxID=2613769 RepID=UPI00145738C8|nr:MULTISPECIES: 4-hydroxy-tetrahydrodipicolinate synthase [unclassified Rhizobium]NLR89508.1 4-hydroxy-tetrahydrodipicolinate synthase [Rhizobium sp. P28RR-XV]NLS21379.1 4-hydroxy-tetrahydrodipicolinate synthase [Rhizobium sp. P40RR-XXII]
MSRPIFQRRIGGAITALVTPFRDGVFDGVDMMAHVEWQLLSGIDGLLVCSLTGEGPTLTEAERIRAIEICVELSEDKVPVIAATGTNDTATTIKETIQAQQLGADAALVTVPYYSKPTQKGVIHHFEQLAAQTELPIIVHNQPSHTAIDLAPTTVARLAEIPGIIGIADGSGGVSRIDVWRPLLPERFGLFASNDASALGFIAAGGHGCFSSAANIVPRLFRSMQHSVACGNVSAAKSIDGRLQPLFSALARESEPTTVKHALSLVSDIEADVRLPLVGVTHETAAAIQAAITPFQLDGSGRFASHHAYRLGL